MAGIMRLFELQYNAESTFAENAETPSSNTFSTRIPCLDYSLSLGQERIVDPGMRSRMNDEGLSNFGVRTASLEIETYLAGHLTTTSSNLTQTWLHDLLSTGFGGSVTNAAGTGITGATTTTSLTFTSNANWLAGMLGWVGAKGDSRADGQAFVVGTVGSPMTLQTAIPAVPNTFDLIYGGLQLFHDESLASTLGTKRFLCGWSSSPTAGEQFQILGCQLAGVEFKFPFGDLPRVRLKYQGAYWQRFGVTIPSASPAIKDQFCAPTAGGSFFINDYGTATRATETPSEMTLSIDMGLEPIVGPGGNGYYQNIVGWVRSKAQPTLSVKIPWKTAYETWFDIQNHGLTYKHILFNANTIDGRRVAFYLPKVFPVGNRPSQPTESNRQTYVQVVFKGIDDLAKSTELGKSAFRMALG